MKNDSEHAQLEQRLSALGWRYEGWDDRSAGSAKFTATGQTRWIPAESEVEARRLLLLAIEGKRRKASEDS